LKEEHRHITCMSTPKGSYQWKVLVMGLKNGNAMFQRMIEWVLRDIENADTYVDNIIIGSTGKTSEEVLINHQKDVRRVLDTLKKTHSYRRTPQGKYVYEVSRILWANSQGGKEITSTGKIVIDTKMGATTNHNGSQGLSVSNQLLFLLCSQLLNLCLTTDGKTTSGEGIGKERITKSSGLGRRRSTCLRKSLNGIEGGSRSLSNRARPSIYPSNRCL
jgi:hypothetical protein